MEKKKRLQQLIGHNIRNIRIEKSMTIEDVALSSGLTYLQVSRLELGKINSTSYTLYILSMTLDVCPSVFFKDVKENINQVETRNYSNGAEAEKPIE
jgi:transcriptional regulator with XRE-family HTH domain